MNERPSKNGGMNGQIGGGGMNECHEVTDERMNDPTDNYVLECGRQGVGEWVSRPH